MVVDDLSLYLHVSELSSWQHVQYRGGHLLLKELDSSTFLSCSSGHIDSRSPNRMEEHKQEAVMSLCHIPLFDLFSEHLMNTLVSEGSQFIILL